MVYLFENKIMTRVRFAPSPTGTLHVGGVRTALYNWLWARKNGGKFILRIEDTDQVRNDPASYNNILTALDWLGLDWDEGPNVGGDHGPYTQSERRDLYKTCANLLIDSGKAYRCNCSSDDLDRMRHEFRGRNVKDTWKYPGVCRDKNVSSDVPHVVRLIVDPGQVVSFDDLVFGNIKTPTSSLYDFVIMRENGVPLYNFAAVIDDYLMDISLVGRGKDHLINTPPQILIYQALGWKTPDFAHLPMLLNQDNVKLSKRDGAVSVDQFRELGFSANGLLNYLMRFGWAHGDKELFSMQEMIDLFSWDKCKKSDGKFDFTKATAINGKNLINDQLVPDKVYTDDLKKFIPDITPDKIALVRAKAKTYKESAAFLSFFTDGSLNGPPADMDPDDKAHVETFLNMYPVLIVNKDRNAFLDLTRKYCESHDVPFARISQALRYWFTHRTVGPDIYQIMTYL
jgi:glutamyl-tRNA synthetase